MDVILLERIAKLGQMGDVVTVKDGFARNFLLPQGKALRATRDNMKRFENERAQLEARNLELKREAEAVRDTLSGQSFTVIRQAGDTGQLYGSVSTRDIAESMSENGFSTHRRQVQLDRPIKMLGLHPVSIRLHPEVEADVTINVARTEDDATRQLRGEDVLATGEEDEDEAGEAQAELAAGDVFEEEVPESVETAETDEPSEADQAGTR